MWKTKITFLLSRTFLFFLKQKYILFLATCFCRILKHLIALAFFLPRPILKNIDMLQQKPQHLPIAKANFKRWIYFFMYFSNMFNIFFWIILWWSFWDSCNFYQQFHFQLNHQLLLLFFTNISTHTFSKRQKFIAFYKYFISCLNWWIVCHYYILYFN